MKILFLLDQVYLPTLGGGNKAARMLLESLARAGHDCFAVARTTATRAGPSTEEAFRRQLVERGVEVEALGGGSYRFRFRGVEVDALSVPPRESGEPIASRVRELDPDWVIVSDDRHRILARAVLDAAPEKLVYMVQTIVHLPFGPHASEPDVEQTDRIARARARVVISRSLESYLERHAGLDSERLVPPVFGEGPFPDLSSFDRGYVTLVNPCVEKGLAILLGLARARPSVEFAAVPTWGADSEVLRLLAAAPNVTMLEPADEIAAVLARTKVLLAPSLWPETLGYVVVEAMLHGVPVMASDIGGLREAKHGVDYLLPVRPARRVDGGFVAPPQDLDPWLAALDELLSDRGGYERCSRASREAASGYVSSVTAKAYEDFLSGLGARRPVST